MKLYSLALLATVAVAQTPAPKPAPNGYTPLNMNSTVVSGDVHIDNNVPGSVYVNSQTGRVVKLSDEEYARRQKLRQALADEEKKIAVAHGVDTEGDLYPCGKPTLTILSNMACVVSPEWKPRYPDKWQFRGQWLLINVPPSAKGPR